MEPRNRVTLGNSSSVVEKSNVERSNLQLKKKDQSDHSDAQKGPSANGISETLTKDAQEAKTKASVSSKNKKPAKDKTSLKVLSSFQNNHHRQILSQSVSCPARRAQIDVMNKSTYKYPSQKEAKHPGGNGNNVKTPISAAQRVSNPDLKNPNKRSSNGTNSKEANEISSGASAKRTSPASLPGIRSMSGKSTFMNATLNFPPSKASNCRSVDQNVKHDDAHSTCSIATLRGQRGNCCSFAFQLNDRAKKRKEFFSMLEEKIQAKEAERTNFQAKSKENQEAEIKKLRKSMTFKATPIPSFYKEPPPKVELKKVPTTSAMSPKLGKGKAAAEGNESSLSPRPNGKQLTSITEKRDKEAVLVASKKPIQKPQTKLQSHDISATKTKGRLPKSRPKTAGSEYTYRNTNKGRDRIQQSSKLLEP